MMTILATTASTPSADWTPVLAPAGALVGVVIGAVLGLAAEPLKLKFAHRARLRQERATQCARLAEMASLTLSGWGTYVEMREEMREKKTALPKGMNQLIDGLHEHRKALRGAATLLALYGPGDLHNAASAVMTADSNLREVFVEDVATTEACFQLCDGMNTAVGEFLKVARKHVR